MALPNPGSSISLSQINTELGRSGSAYVSLDSAENGSYAAINNCSTYRPLSTNPASFSEWYRYDHSQSCTLCDNNATVTLTTVQIPFQPICQATHVLYINVANLGDIQPVISIDSTSQNIGCTIYLDDAATGEYIGELFRATDGTGTTTGERLGVKNTGNVKATLYFSNNTSTPATVTFSFKLNCPTTLGCNTTMTTVIPYCGCGGSRIYHWVDLGTTSRTVTVTYTTPSIGNGGGTQTIEVNYAGSNLTLTGSTGYGTSQTFSFSYTYNGSTSLARIAWMNDCWC